MQRNKKLSDAFIVKIAGFCGGAIQPDQIDRLISNIENEIQFHFFTDSSESNLIRIIENQFDKIFFLKECLEYPHHLEILITIAANSNYLSDILVRNPEYFFSITNPENLKKKSDQFTYNKLVLDTVSRFKTFDAKINALRSLKRKELLRIGLVDIYLKADVTIITEYLSFLAKSISSALFDLCYKEILAKNNIRTVSSQYCMIALGKLGGNELNYSSDIDLMVFTNKNSLIRKKINYNQIITEAVQLFIEQASSLTSKGFLYRVDFRLRPDGKNAPLCGSISQYLQYYELRGEDWERQMLIKSGFICGSKSLYLKFTAYLENFIYPVSFTISPLQQIKKLKMNIEKRNVNEENIKLIPGGIRDIEFSVQALQLLNGGKNKSVRTGNTLTAIEELTEIGLLSQQEEKTFTRAYIFYRKIEHYLQLMNNAQTHTIPDSGEIPEKLSYYLSFKGSAPFRKVLKNSRAQVLEIYHSITGEENEKSIFVFDRINFADKNRARQNIDFLLYGKGILGTKKFDKITTTLFENIQVDIANYLDKSVQPDTALENLVRIIKSAQLPKLWYKEFEDKEFLNLILRICEYSQFSINLFAEDKILRDLLLTRKCFILLNKNEISELKTKELIFILSVQFCVGLIITEDVNKILSTFIKFKIDKIFTEYSINKEWKQNFIVIALGSLGAMEFSFASDIDLIFVVKDISKYQNLQADFQKILIQIKKDLYPLDVDCRLRPEGKSSNLVWDFDSYVSYFKNRARVWEFQAFLKANLMCGNKKLFNKLLNIFLDALKNIEPHNIKKEMLQMRNKLISSPDLSGALNIKKTAGALTDINFIFSYFLLLKYDSAQKCIGTGTEKSIKILSLNKEIKKYSEVVLYNFKYLKIIELANQTVFDSSTSRIPVDEKRIKTLSLFLGYNNSKSFIAELNRILNYNLGVFKKVFEKNEIH